MSRSRRACAVRPAIEAFEPRRLMVGIAVTNNNDSGPGSPRAAVAAAAANDTIDLTARTGTVTLATTLNISRAVNSGAGRNLLRGQGGRSVLRRREADAGLKAQAIAPHRRPCGLG